PGSTGGRWTGPEAVLRLARRGREAGLFLDLMCARPEGETTGRVEVNGRVVGALPAGKERQRIVLDVADVPGTVLEVRFVVANPHIPSAYDPANRDGRSLGVFV